MSPLAWSLVAALALAAVHALAGSLRGLDVLPRSRWLSAAGGVSVAYVFVHLLPELAEGQEVLATAAGGALGFLEHHVYLVALAGLVVFYGLERMVRRHRREREEDEASDPGVFWLHVASFTVYNALVGYLLVHRLDTEEGAERGVLWYTVAMALHFLVTDYDLRHTHQEDYLRLGRWILVAAIVLGWGLGAATEISEAAVATLVAFLGGAVVLNVLKEELPEERESRYWAFLAGAAAYAGLLLLA